MFVILLITLGILTVCIILMSIQIILKKNGRFPNGHIGNNQALRKKGIHCAKTQDWEASEKKNLFEYLEQ
jgi:hypothetical protein